MLYHKIFLLRRPERHAQKIRTAGIDLRHDFGFFFILEVAVPEARDLQTRDLLFQVCRCRFRDAGLASQQIDAAAQLCAQFDGAMGKAVVKYS